MSFVLCCVDGENYSQSACDYAVLISNNLNLPLKFLNIVEHSSKYLRFIRKYQTWRKR